MADEIQERSLFFSRRPDKTIVSKSFLDATGQKLRIISKVVDGEEGLRFARVSGETVLRVTPLGRYAVKATVLEDSRGINVLTIQRFNTRSGPIDREHFSMVGQQTPVQTAALARVQTLADRESGRSEGL